MQVTNSADAPSTEDRVLLKGVFHAHTHASRDCRMTPEIIVRRCLDEGVDVIAITDHNETAGAFELQRKAPFQVIVGEEIRCAEGGEIIGLFLSKTIARGFPAHSVITEIRSQGGLIYLPHPFDPIRTKHWPKGFVETILPDADIVEVFNARSLLPSGNAKAASAAAQYGKVSCAGADAHFPSEIGRTIVTLPPFDTPNEFLISLRSARLILKRNPFWVLGATRWISLWR